MRQPGRALDGALKIDLRQRLAPALACRLHGEQDGEVRRQRLEPAHLDDLHAGRGGRAVELVDHPADERDLAGQVRVVGAGGDACLDHRPAVERVGANEVEHHAGPRRHRRERIGIVEVGDDRLRRAHSRFPQQALELGGIAGGRRPARARLRAALGEIGGHAAAGHAGGPEDDDVEVALDHL